MPVVSTVTTTGSFYTVQLTSALLTSHTVARVADKLTSNFVAMTSGGALSRVAQPDEVGELVSFLASKNAAFITGECIAIDGGRQNLGAR